MIKILQYSDFQEDQDTRRFFFNDRRRMKYRINNNKNNNPVYINITHLPKCHAKLIHLNFRYRTLIRRKKKCFHQKYNPMSSVYIHARVTLKRFNQFKLNYVNALQ